MEEGDGGKGPASRGVLAHGFLGLWWFEAGELNTMSQDRALSSGNPSPLLSDSRDPPTKADFQVGLCFLP